MTSQIIQTLSAVDRDEPENGHHFLFSLTAEAAGNLSFTLRDNRGKDWNKQLGHDEGVNHFHIISSVQFTSTDDVKNLHNITSVVRSSLRII